MPDKERKMKERIESESKAVMRITNDDLVCKNCLFAYDDSVKFGNTSQCAIYDSKPNAVLLGEECKFKKERK